MDVFSTTVGLEERGSEVIPIVLEETQLRKLVRDLGSDLEQLRKLKRSQVIDVCSGLENAGFVECFEVQEAIQDNHSVLPGNCNTDVEQPTPSSPFTAYLSMSDPKTLGPSNNIPPLCVEPDSWMNDIYNHGHYPGSEVDRLLDATQTLDESVLFMAPETIPLSISHPATGVVSPTETISTPGFDGGASSYSTPSNMCFNSPQLGERLTLPGLTRSNQTPVHLLQYCVFGQGGVLEEKRIRRVLEAEGHLLTKDPCGMLRPLLGEWNKNMLHGLHALGLPVLWKGIQGAVNYLRVLDADETSRFLDPIAKRVGQVLLYINYAELCKHPKKCCPPSTSKPNVTHILNCILDAYPDDPRISMSPQSRRNKISGYHVRRGRWWWRLAGTLGVGVLLIGDNSLMSVMCVFQLAHCGPINADI